MEALDFLRGKYCLTDDEQLSEAKLASSLTWAEVVKLLREFRGWGGVEQIPRANAGLASGEDGGKGGPKNPTAFLGCPFCGNTDVTEIDLRERGKIVMCTGCGASIGESSRDEWLDLTITIKWNTRGGVRF